ncbi:MAG: thioredoxin family protein [Planctomycetaceae bacterium]
MTRRERQQARGGLRGLYGVSLAVRAALAWACLLLGSAVAGQGWLTSYEEAMEAAREQGKPVLILFTGSDWCTYCKLLEEKVLHTETFRNWAQDRLILVMIDLPKEGISAEERAIRSRVCIKYGVRTFPSVVLVGADGAKITTQSGYMGQAADSWVAAMDGHMPAREAATGPAVASLDAAVETAREERRPVLVVVSKAGDSASKMRVASLIKDPEFGAFARENFVVAEAPAPGEATGSPAGAPQSLLGEDGVAAEGIRVIVTDDGQTPLHSESGSQPPQRIVSGLRRFLAGREAVRR